jgi:hypothetical protein
MADWITFQDLLKRWEVKKFEAVEYLKKGLQPYSKNTGKPLNCPPDYHLGHIVKDLIFSSESALRAVSHGRELNNFGLARSEIESAKKKQEIIENDDLDLVSWKWLTELSDEDCKPLFSYLDEAIFRNDDVVEFEKKYKLKQKDVESEVFPCSAGTKWEEVKITLIENEAVRIETPLGISRFSYHELGMSDKRSANRPTMLWGLFKIFAKNQGYISPTNDQYVPKLPDTAKRLNKHLRDLFDIHDSIFTDHYKAEKGYRTKIFFSDQTTAG